MDQLLLDLVLCPRFVHELLERITTCLLQTMELPRQEADFDCARLSDDYGSQQRLLIFPDMWRRFIAAPLRRIIDRAHDLGQHLALHFDGAIGAILHDLVDAGVDLLHPVQSECVDPAWVKREFRSAITI